MENQVKSLILKVAGNTCNIACKYCFETPKKIKNFVLEPLKFEEIIKSYNSKLVITFHGGEPLLVGKSIMEKYLNILRNYYGEKVVNIKIQTNGILIDQEWIDLIFKKYNDLNIEIALSLDGSEIMNKLRIDHKGIKTFENVINAYNLLGKNGIKAGMLSVLNSQSINYVEEYIELIKKIENIKFIKLNPMYNIEKNELTEDSITPKQFTDFITTFSKYYIEENLYKKFAVEPILSILQIINNKPTKYCNYKHSPNNFKCSKFITIYPDGTQGICDCFSVNDFNLGNIFETHTQNCLSYEKEIFYSEIEVLKKECVECSINKLCNEGCLSQRYYMRENKELLKEFCNQKKRLITYFQNYKIGNNI